MKQAPMHLVKWLCSSIWEWMQRPYYHNLEVINSISKTMKNREKKIKVLLCNKYAVSFKLKHLKWTSSVIIWIETPNEMEFWLIKILTRILASYNRCFQEEENCFKNLWMHN